MVNGSAFTIRRSPFTIYHLQFLMMNNELRINMLGPFVVTAGSETAEFRTDALRVLLAYLAAHQGTPQRRDSLAGLLSPDRPDKEALTYLRNRLTRLRRALADDEASPPWFDIDRKQIGLRTGDDVFIDVTRFDQLLGIVKSHPHRQLAGCPTCVAHLEEAVALIRGEYLAGLNFPSDVWESWLIGQREHYQQQALEAMTHLRETQIMKGAWTAVLEIAQRQLSFEPWLEAAHRAIMQAHQQLGDRNAALAQFEQCTEQLWDELGVEPEEETVALFERIKANEAESGAGEQEAGGATNLPVRTGRFFGRQPEQVQLLRQLVDPNYRLITLVGTGGIGKTRLASEVARQVTMSFPDGVWFVPLGGVKGEAEQIKIAVGEAAGLGQPDKQLTGDQVLNILREKRMLLLFDNCETVLDQLGFIAEWLRRAPHIAILATSREPLNFQAESLIALGGLPTGEAEISAAEALFAERGQMARHDFALTAENLPQVREICQLVDGSPLGIGLAAAWVRRRSLVQIVTEIGRSLDFLTTRLRDIDPRHRSIRAVFETSWQLLTAEEQEALAALAVFPTTFTAEAAEEIAQATLFDLDLLCEKSLLQQHHESERYSLHSLVRQFAMDKLGGRLSEVEQRFVGYFLQFAGDHQQNYEALRPEWRNFSAGVRKAHTLAAWPQVLDFVQMLDEAWFRQIRFQEMREGLTLALEAAEQLQASTTIARTLLRLGEIEMEQNDYEAAETHLEEAVERLMRLEDSLGIAAAKYFSGRIKMEQSQYEQAKKLFIASKQLFEEEEIWLGVAKNLSYIGLSYTIQNPDYETAQTHLEKSVLLQKQLPTSPAYAEALRLLARVKNRSGNYADAESHLNQAKKIARELHDIGEYAAVLYELMIFYKHRSQIETALQVGSECLAYFQELGSLRWQALVKTQLGLLRKAKMQPYEAIQLLEQGLRIFVELGDSFEEAYSHYYLYGLYVETGEAEKSLLAKESVRHLAHKLHIPYLQKSVEEM